MAREHLVEQGGRDRVLLRFLYLEGLIDRDLAVAVTPVANWRLASLVKALDASSVARLLDSCDQGTAVGRRDFAILLLLSRLGPRIGEVAALRLDDLDWRAGELVVCERRRVRAVENGELSLPRRAGPRHVRCEDPRGNKAGTRPALTRRSSGAAGRRRQ